MSNKIQPIETLLTKLEEAHLKAKHSLVSEILYLYVHEAENKALLEAFREVLGALRTIQTLATPAAPIVVIDDIASEVVEALARANEIASEVLRNE